ncbi:MAG: hypothetical protein ACRBBP_06140 [Bdellovibrionales bacterium]
MADAAYVTALLGPKAESYTSPLAKRSRSNPISLFLSLDFKLKPSWYLSLGASGEFDLGDVATTGFTLAAFVKYFVIGSPDLVSTSGKDARIQLALPYSIFTGVGLFQKDVKFANDRTLENVDTSLGGLGLVVGGTYNLNQKYFLVSQAQYLASGLSSTTTYTSMEFYGGAGFRF